RGLVQMKIDRVQIQTGAPIIVDHRSTIIWRSTISHGALMAAPKPAAHPSHEQISSFKPKCPNRDQQATHLTNSIWAEPIANEQRLHPSKIQWLAAPCPDLAPIRQPFITSVHWWSSDHGMGHRRLQQQKSILISRQSSRSSIRPEPPTAVLQAGNKHARQTISTSNKQQYTSFQPSKQLGPAADREATWAKPYCGSNKQ
ncbi:hypothetical protein ACLOJK_035140, partial [Asimina triloba]